MLYENIDPFPQTPNLMVEDIIEQSNVEIFMPQPMIPIIDADQLPRSLISFSELSPVITCVLIISPTNQWSYAL